MHPYITKENLAELGITIDEANEASILEHLNRTLEERIGTEITESLTDEELETLAELQENGDENALQTWLTEHVPTLSDIVKDERDILIGEVAEQSGSLNNL